MGSWFGFFIAISALSCVFTRWLLCMSMRVAERLGLLDVPDGTVKKHEIPMPCVGGIAVFWGTMVPFMLIAPWTQEVMCVAMGLFVLHITGLIDDIWILKPHQKLFGQLIGTFFFLYAGFYLHQTILPCWLAIFISAIWILAVINALNLIDVMDGLAGSLALSAACYLFVFSCCFAHMVQAMMFAGLSGALIAFLLYNWPPATVYLGDAGSLFLGGVLGALPFYINWGQHAALGYMAFLTILAIPLFELGSLVLIRTYNGLSFYKASPHHFCMYLLSRSASKAMVLLYCIFMSMMGNILALLLMVGYVDAFSFYVLFFSLTLVWITVLLLHNYP